MKRARLHATTKALILSVLLLGAASSLTAQTKTARASRNYGFVSPNTREDLKLEDAIRGMNSEEESNLRQKARGLGCVVKRKITTMRAVGSWSDGAEHSILIRANTDESTIRYLMSRLGRDANQKAVIYFHPQTNGRARIYILHATKRMRDFALISRLLDVSGIAFRTLVPLKHETTIYVVDTEGNLVPKIAVAARRLRTRVTTQTGNANFIGDDSIREKGQAVFAQEIRDYESKHPGLPPPCEARKQ